MEKDTYYLYPGYIFFSKSPYKITTVLGSCISVCLWDKKNNFGGMNHYIYADFRKTENKGISGSVAIPHLIKLMLDSGSKLDNLEANIVGGASSEVLSSDVAVENIKFAKKTLENYKIKIVYMNTGGFKGRKVSFDNYTGKVEVQFLKENSKRVDANE